MRSRFDAHSLEHGFDERPHTANGKPDWSVVQIIAEEIGLGGSPSPTVRAYMTRSAE